jgi:hypothetical protein
LPVLVVGLLPFQPSGSAQEPNPAAPDIQALQRKLQQAQEAGQPRAGDSLKRRDLKGQPLSSQGGEMEGLTPEQRKMYEEIQQQLEVLKENVKKRDAALEELTR